MLSAIMLHGQALDAAVEHFVDMVFLLRLRTSADRRTGAAVFESVWGRPLRQHRRPSLALDPHTVRVGRAVVPRGGDAGVLHASASAAAQSEGLRLENSSLRALEAVMQARPPSSLVMLVVASHCLQWWSNGLACYCH